jgi:tetratricopeptide (TPR) repeat protein
VVFIYITDKCLACRGWAAEPEPSRVDQRAQSAPNASFATTSRLRVEKALTIADYNEATRLNPKDGGAFFNRGVASLAKGSVADAHGDFAQANELNPKYAYAALWLDIAERRNRLPSRLAELSAKLDMTAWPAPVVRHFMGEIDLSALLAAASDPDPVKAKGHLCEARFYGGELILLNGGKDVAERFFRLAASECPLRNDGQRMRNCGRSSPRHEQGKAKGGSGRMGRSV